MFYNSHYVQALLFLHKFWITCKTSMHSQQTFTSETLFLVVRIDKTTHFSQRPLTRGLKNNLLKTGCIKYLFSGYFRVFPEGIDTKMFLHTQIHRTRVVARADDWTLVYYDAGRPPPNDGSWQYALSSFSPVNLIRRYVISEEKNDSCNDQIERLDGFIWDRDTFNI